MSEILSNIVVEQTSINFVPDNNNININPEAIQLNVYTGAAPGAGQSNNGELLYNNVNLIDGVPNTLVSGGNLQFTNLANLKIAGGTNGYVLQTDGLGNLAWVAGVGNIIGNGVPGGSVNQIQYNKDGANFGGSAGFTFDPTSNLVSMPNVVSGNIYANSGTIGASLFTGTLTTAAQPNITSVGNLTSLTVAGTTTIQEALEKVTANSTGSSGTINFDVLTQAIVLKTSNATANFTINVRGNSTVALNSVMSNNQSLTCTYINTNGSTPYYMNNFQIDGSNVTPLWVQGNPPTIGSISGKDVYSFNIVKTAPNVYTVFGTYIGYK